MTGLVHISKYLNEFKVELDSYDKTLTEKAEEVSQQVKEIHKELSKLEVDPFSFFWTEDVPDSDGYFENFLSVGLHWNGSKVMFLFEDEVHASYLGSNRQIRVAAGKYLDSFLEEGLKSIRKKTEELLN